MAVVLAIIDLLVCRRIHGCGCFAVDPAPRKSGEVDCGVAYCFFAPYLMMALGYG